jgi:hypothetical protein
MEIIVIILIAFIAILYLLGVHKTKGAIGESRVSKKLNKLRKKEYKVFNDVLLEASRGYTQIDHIVISIYGIFVIETKTYDGWIHGNEKSEFWTQTIYDKKTKFRNPIKQNWSHIYALKEVLSDFKNVKYHPIVVFAGSAELKNIESTMPVIYANQLYKFLTDKSRNPYLSIEQVENVADGLSKIIRQERKAKRKHIRQVKHHVKEQKLKRKLLICPRCNGNLVLRDGRYGKFYSCSNYPKCKYSQNYESRRFF